MYSGEFERIGRRLFAEHLVGGNFGNLSVRKGEGFFIKRTGTYLNEPAEPVFIPFTGDVPKEASSEYRVHRHVYLRTEFAAIVHAHPPYAIAMSFDLDEIKPQDSEGLMFCPRIPVVDGKPGTDELALHVAEGLTLAPVVIARAHGTFTGGKTLDEAYLFTSMAEHSCRVLTLAGKFRK